MIKKKWKCVIDKQQMPTVCLCHLDAWMASLAYCCINIKICSIKKSQRGETPWKKPRGGVCQRCFTSLAGGGSNSIWVWGSTNLKKNWCWHSEEFKIGGGLTLWIGLAHGDCAIYSYKLCYLHFQNYCRSSHLSVICAVFFKKSLSAIAICFEISGHHGVSWLATMTEERDSCLDDAMHDVTCARRNLPHVTLRVTSRTSSRSGSKS